MFPPADTSEAVIPSASYRNGSDSCDSVPLRYVFFSMSIPQMYQRVLSAGGQSTVSSAVLKGWHVNTLQVLDNKINITLPYAFIPVLKCTKACSDLVFF